MTRINEGCDPAAGLAAFADECGLVSGKMNHGREPREPGRMKCNGPEMTRRASGLWPPGNPLRDRTCLSAPARRGGQRHQARDTKKTSRKVV